MLRCISSRSVLVRIAAIATFLMAWPALAQSPRAALVIGNSAYVHAAPLANPANDANAVADVLKGMGFDVILGLDLESAPWTERCGNSRVFWWVPKPASSFMQATVCRSPAATISFPSMRSFKASGISISRPCRWILS